MTTCGCDHVSPAMYSAVRHRARIRHECDECGMPITTGETYERVRAIWEGRPETVRTCPDCLMIRDALEEMPCFCWEHNNLLDAVAEHFRAAGFAPGLRTAYLRILAKHRWRRAHLGFLPDGTRRPPR